MQNTTATSQTEQILKYLKSGNSITPMRAYNMFNCLRLGARIWEIRHKLKYPVTTEMIKVSKDKEVAKYSIEK